MRTDQSPGLLNESQFIRRKEPLGGIAVPLVRDPTRFTAKTVGGNEQGNRNLSFPQDRESIFENALITIVKRDSDKASIAIFAASGKIAGYRTGQANKKVHLMGELLTFVRFHRVIHQRNKPCTDGISQQLKQCASNRVKRKIKKRNDDLQQSGTVLTKPLIDANLIEVGMQSVSQRGTHDRTFPNVSGWNHSATDAPAGPSLSRGRLSVRDGVILFVLIADSDSCYVGQLRFS